MHEEIGAAVIGGLFLVGITWWGIRNDKKVRRYEKSNRHDSIARSIFESLSDFDNFNSLRASVDEILDKTKADRFLLLVAVNKKDDFNDITVLYEQHKGATESNNAVARYHHISVDDQYRTMLKDSERNGPIDLCVIELEPCLIKTIYEIEDVKHSRVTFLLRQHIDEHNDAVIYSSIATHEPDSFTTFERTKIQLAYESNIGELIKNLFT
jgi:hypothetical protein